MFTSTLTNWQQSEMNNSFNCVATSAINPINPMFSIEQSIERGYRGKEGHFGDKHI